MAAVEFSAENEVAATRRVYEYGTHRIRTNRVKKIASEAERVRQHEPAKIQNEPARTTKLHHLTASPFLSQRNAAIFSDLDAAGDFLVLFHRRKKYKISIRID